VTRYQKDHGDAPYALRRLLRPRSQRPSHHAAKARNKFALPHVQSSSFKIGV
jgi:hypothetical protein